MHVTIFPHEDSVMNMLHVSKQLWHEAENSSPSGAELFPVKYLVSYEETCNYINLKSCCFMKVIIDCLQ
jgi:hypothetical protein